MDIRLASIPRDSGQLFSKTPVGYIHNFNNSSVMDVHMYGEKRGLVLIAVYKLEVPDRKSVV